MKCVYCYNPEIVFGDAQLSENEALHFLSSRKSLLEGAVISGGEATVYPNLVPFCRAVKELGFEIKLDTNGCRPKVLAQLLAEDLLSYVALDIKAPPSKFQMITQSKLRFDLFFSSLRMLCEQAKVMFEVRTTVHTDYLDDSDLLEIQSYLLQAGYGGVHYLQRFRSYSETIGKIDPPSRELSPRSLGLLPLATQLR